MKMSLSQEEIFDLEVRHKTERDKRIADRIKAVLWYNKGWQIKDIATALFISTDRISRHMYRAPWERNQLLILLKTRSTLYLVLDTILFKSF
jgi:hypothetical protein